MDPQGEYLTTYLVFEKMVDHLFEKIGDMLLNVYLTLPLTNCQCEDSPLRPVDSVPQPQ